MEFSSDKMDVNSVEDNIFNRDRCKKQEFLHFIIGLLATEREHEVWKLRKLGKDHLEISRKLNITERASICSLNNLRNKMKERITLSKLRGNILED